ncbi:ArsR/SmtB family transcription factor [Dongia sp.]|jgi:DNA-binding transcriptional ArsR family regulator|uniref:ArsR/SmtB family transcription factor n=1 Tax=Dongia sp. TaxID=1977262 RepID=UPI0035B2B60D
MIPVTVCAAPRFELFLAFAAEAPERWPDSPLPDNHLPGNPLPALGELAPDISLAELLKALEQMAETLPDRRIIAFAGTAFAPFWRANAAHYAAAAARLQARLAAHPRADLGALFGFEVSLDLQHLGLRQRSGAARRIPVGQIAAVHLYPSAFNAAASWCLGAGRDGRQRVHLPVQDDLLAAAILPLAAPMGAETRLPRAGRPAQAPQFAAICRALGDASRLAMAEMMAREPITGAEIGRRLHLSTPAVTHHLNILRQAGLVDEVRLGTSIQLSLRRQTVQELGRLALDHFSGAGAAPVPRRSRRRKGAL